MKKLCILILLAASGLWGQATPAQHTASHLDACNQVATTQTQSTTLTLTPSGGGQLVYICAIDIENCAGGSAVAAAAPTTITTTGLTGSPVYLLGSGVAAGLCTQTQSMAFPNGGLQATGPGNVTFVTPAYATNQTVRINIYWRSAWPQ